MASVIREKMAAFCALEAMGAIVVSRRSPSLRQMFMSEWSNCHGAMAIRNYPDPTATAVAR